MVQLCMQNSVITGVLQTDDNYRLVELLLLPFSRLFVADNITLSTIQHNTNHLHKILDTIGVPDNLTVKLHLARAEALTRDGVAG